MAKQVIFAAENREKLLKGVNSLSNAVKVTLGPKGRNVLIDKSFGAPLVTKDGVRLQKKSNWKKNWKTWAHRWLRKLRPKLLM